MTFGFRPNMPVSRQFVLIPRIAVIEMLSLLLTYFVYTAYFRDVGTNVPTSEDQNAMQDETVPSSLEVFVSHLPYVNNDCYPIEPGICSTAFC